MEQSATLHRGEAKRLVAQVAKDAGVSAKAAEAAVQAALQGFSSALSNGDDVQLLDIIARWKGAEGQSSPSVEESAFAPDARARALLRGVRLAQEDLRAAGGAYTLEQVQTLLGISRQSIDKRVRSGALLAVTGPGNRRRYPSIQFEQDGSVVRGLQDVARALPGRNPWVLLNFLVGPDSRLGGQRPIDLLKAGEIETVVEAAHLIDEQGA